MNEIPPPPPEGVWRSWQDKFKNDFRSARNAEENDGLVAPAFDTPFWINGEGAVANETIEVARRAHQQALDRIESAESRAARLIQTDLTLLALNFTLVGFEINRLRDAGAAGWTYFVVLAVAFSAIFCLALSAIEAIGVDRVSLVEHAKADDVGSIENSVQRKRMILIQELKGARIAHWSARHKLTEFLQARAWLTRGVVALLVTGVSALIVWIFAEPVPKGTAPVEVRIESPFPMPHERPRISHS